MQKNAKQNEALTAEKTDFALHLERIAKIQALSAVRTEKRDDQVGFLHCIGYTPTEIATLLDTSANTVSVALYQRKKKQVGPKRPRKK